VAGGIEDFFRAPGHRFDTAPIWRALPGGMRRRWWLFRPLDLIARHWPLLKKRRGLLVIRMDGIGDMVLFRRALDHYAAAFNVAKEDITILGCKSWQSIADEVFKGYRVEAINEHAFAKRPIYRFAVSLRIRRLAPRICVCDSYFRRALMADSLAWVANAPRQIVSLPYINEPTRPEFLFYLSQGAEVINTGDYPTHEIIRHYRFVSAVGGKTVPPGPPRITWRDSKPPIGEGASYVVLNPGSNSPGRRWPLAGYIGLAERFRKKGLRVVFVGAAEENPDAVRRRALVGKSGVIDLTGRTTLAELLDLMKGAACVVGNDSGPAHLSIALGAPTVVVVGGGHFGCFFPYPEDVAPTNARFVYEEMECYHCFWRCPKRADRNDAFPCIAAISEEMVWKQAWALTEGAGK
jgi:ADP-heptose:LPS heptosyltransferase